MDFHRPVRKRRSTSRAYGHPEVISIPKDAVLEILLRLPVRSLVRFRCVSKEWCVLIKSSLFKEAYLALQHAGAGVDELMVVKHTFGKGGGRHGPRIYKSFVTSCYGDYKSLARSVSTASSKRDFYISGDNFSGKGVFINHVNGVLCFAGIGYDRKPYISLLNPSLREVRELPCIGFECFTQGVGFGYDDATDDYKVVAIATLCDEAHKHVALVYNLSTHSWKILGLMSAFVSECYASNPTFMRWPDCCRSIFLNGSIHWCIGTWGVKPKILAFNMTRELFQEIHFPQGLKPSEYGQGPSLITVDKSTLALVSLTHPSDAFGHGHGHEVLDIWVMKEYGVTESWSKQYSIKSLPSIHEPLSYWRKDHLLLQTVDRDLVYYDRQKGQIYKPGNRKRIRVPRINSWSVEFINCISSFVSVK